MTLEEELELDLIEAVQEELNREIIRAIRDPNYVMQSRPMTFESEELKRAQTKAWNDRYEYLKKLRKSSCK